MTILLIKIKRKIIAFMICQFAKSNFFIKVARELVRVYDNDCNADMEKNGERFLQNFLTAKASPTSVYVDVGANVGDWSEALVLGGGRIGRLIAVDPSRKNLELVKEKLNRLNFNKFELCECALSDSIGQTQFYINKDPNLSGHDSIFNMTVIGYQEGIECINVETSTLDELAKKLTISDIYFLKIDVEGNELAVLKGAESLLEKENIDFIQIEFGHAARAARVYLHDIINYTNKYNYIIFVILPTGLMPLNFTPFTENRYTYINFLLVKKSEVIKLKEIIIENRS